VEVGKVLPSPMVDAIVPTSSHWAASLGSITDNTSDAVIDPSDAAQRLEVETFGAHHGAR